MKNKKLNLSLLSMLGASLISCNGAVSNEVKQNLQDKTPQDNLCVVSDWSGIKNLCKPGEIVYFEPDRWGNEQLPTMFIALFCDTNKSVYFTNGGVVCTFVTRKSLNGKLIDENKSNESATNATSSK